MFCAGVYFTGVSAMDIFIEHFGTPKADGSGYEIKAADLSVMTSMINVGELVGSLTAAPLNDWFGRKGVFLIGAVTVIIGVVLQLATDHSHGLIIGGRIILGYGVGAFSSTSPLYIGVSASFFPLVSFCRSHWREKTGVDGANRMQQAAVGSVDGRNKCWLDPESARHFLSARLNPLGSGWP